MPDERDPELEELRRRKLEALQRQAQGPTTPPEPVNLAGEEIDRFLAAHDLVLLDFWAPWCGPCKAIAPVLESVAAEREEVAIGKVNVDDHPAAAQRFRVQSIPTMVLARKGTPVDRIVGALPKAQLLDRLDALASG